MFPVPTGGSAPSRIVFGVSCQQVPYPPGVNPCLFPWGFLPSGSVPRGPKCLPLLPCGFLPTGSVRAPDEARALSCHQVPYCLALKTCFCPSRGFLPTGAVRAPDEARAPPGGVGGGRGLGARGCRQNHLPPRGGTPSLVRLRGSSLHSKQSRYALTASGQHLSRIPEIPKVPTHGAYLTQDLPLTTVRASILPLVCPDEQWLGAARGPCRSPS